MQIIYNSECLKDHINLSVMAKEYHEFLYNNNDKPLYKMSMKYIKNKQYTHCMSNGVKEKCISLIEETWNNVNNSELFYQYLLVNVSCNEIMIESLYNMFVDMLMYCQDKITKIE
jgi:hypothetical protein